MQTAIEGSRAKATAPKFNPINGRTVEKELMGTIGTQHVVIYGDINTRKTHRLKTMAAHAHFKKRQVIVFAMDATWFGLNQAGTREFDRYGANVHGYTIDADDADDIAASALGKEKPSQIICLQHLPAEEVSRFLKRYFDAFVGHANLNTVICLDLLDETVGRKRHRDSFTAVNLKSLFLRGKSMGLTVYATATSTTEIPIELVHQTGVPMFGRTTHEANFQGLRKIDSRIARHAKDPFGVSMLEIGAQFFCPQDGEGRAPYFAPMPDTDVGTGDPVDPKGRTDREKKSVEALEAARKARADAKTNGAGKGGRDGGTTGTTSRTTRKGAPQNLFASLEGGSIKPDLYAGGAKNVDSRIGVTRILLSHASHGSIRHAHRPDRADAISTALGGEVAAAATWADSRKRRYAGLMSNTLAAAVRAIASREDAKEAETFLSALAGTGPADQIVNGLARRLRGMDSPLTSAPRMDAALVAWGRHMRQVARDRAPALAREAVVVQLHPGRMAAAAPSLPACA